MNRSRKIVILVGVAVGVAVAGGGAAVAASDAFSPEAQREAVIDDAAKRLDVTPEALRTALEEALKNRVAEAVESGRLSKVQAEKLKERIDSGAGLLFDGVARGHGFGHFGHGAGLGAAASYLGLTGAELSSKLGDGRSLAEIADAEGKTVDGLVQALMKDATERIDRAVEDGRLTEDRADRIRAGLQERLGQVVNRKPGAARPVIGPRFDHD